MALFFCLRLLFSLEVPCSLIPLTRPLPVLQRAADLSEALAESQAALKAANLRAAAATAEATALASFR